MADEETPMGEELNRAVELLIDRFAELSIRYALVGGLATTLRGRPRLTQDADFVLDIPQITLPKLLDGLVESGFSLDRTTVIREYVQQGITAFYFGSVRIDWLKPVLPLYARALADATALTWNPSHQVRVATAEGLVLTKLLAFRPQDQGDIKTLLIANKDDINLDLIRREWSAVADASDPRTVWLETKIREVIPPGK